MKNLQPQNFEMFSGNDKKLKFSTIDQDDVVQPITGATIEWALSNRAKSKKKLVIYTTSDQITITDDVGGLFEVDMLDVDTEGLTGQKYYYEAKITDLGGLRTTVAFGWITLADNLI